MLFEALREHAAIISIHALREEGDRAVLQVFPLSEVFLSTPSARRATYRPATLHPDTPISIHALREEGDFFVPNRLLWEH